MTANDSKLHKLGKRQDFDAKPTIVSVSGIELSVFRSDGDIHVIRNVCPHQQGPVGEGTIETEEQCIYCPWHGWKFDIETGENPIDEKKIRVYDATVKDGDVYVRL